MYSAMTLLYGQIRWKIAGTNGKNVPNLPKSQLERLPGLAWE